MSRRPLTGKDLPRQPGDELPVREDDPDGPQWGELFGRPRVLKPKIDPVVDELFEEPSKA